MLMMVVVASIPTAIIGFTFDSTIIGDFYSEMHLVGGCLIFTGILIWISKNYDGKKQIDDFKFSNAFFRPSLVMKSMERAVFSMVPPL